MSIPDVTFRGLFAMDDLITHMLKRAVQDEPAERTALMALIDHLEGDQGLTHRDAVREAIEQRRIGTRRQEMASAIDALRPGSPYVDTLRRTAREDAGLDQGQAMDLCVREQLEDVVLDNEPPTRALGYMHFHQVNVSPRWVLKWKRWIDGYRQGEANWRTGRSTFLSRASGRPGGQQQQD